MARPAYVTTEAGLVRLPPSVRTLHQRVMYLLRKGYLWGAYMLAAHSDKVLVALLQRVHPNVPWKNMLAASKHR